jgi:hypothetical protein
MHREELKSAVSGKDNDKALKNRRKIYGGGVSEGPAAQLYDHHRGGCNPDRTVLYQTFGTATA